MSVLNTVKKDTFTGAKIIVETLKNIGVDTIFGYPGGVVLNVYDELFKQNDIKHYLVRHEQAAVHAAEGYARVSGKCGVVLVTSGPGASNTVTGIANAYLDGYPLVVLTGQVSSSLIGKDAFQEVNIVDMTKTCTKAGFQVHDITDLEDTLNKAFHIAMTGKKGPVVVDIAKNIFGQSAEFCGKFQEEYSYPKIFEQDVKAILNEIRNSKNPVIVCGGGVVHSNAVEELIKFSKNNAIPVVSTLMGLSAYPSSDENYLGMIGIFGQKSANQALRESDLILSLGARFNDRITCCFKPEELSRKFIQVDINQNEISRNIPAYRHVVGDINEFLFLINTFSSNIDKKALDTEKINRLKSLNKPNKPISNQLHSFEVIKAISDYTKGMDCVVSTEVGQHQMFVAQNYNFNFSGQFITSGGLGTMGFGFPAAIGACIAKDNQPVICFAGDGSFQMNEQELATCVDYNLPVKIFILNNGYLGMVRQLQQNNCGGRYSETKISNPDFMKLAQAYGIEACRVSKNDEIKSALSRAFAVNAPFIIDFAVESMEVV